jgi:hypothetical protein
MKKPKKVEDKMLEELNDFMKKYGIEEISFGKHGIKKTDDKKSKSVIKKSK